ncbi:RrF2 family transcriptional regulator [Gordonibacter sp.]|uniref:RrF2 family transcriptional regulator n=1 Tax=Gordonibacter sp. TaxID=1968902 RepID=UPI002FC95979
MDITRRCDYACRILRAAYKSGDSYVSVSDIAEAEDIPYAFARSIQHDLVKAELIKTVRGARGGLVLNCDPAEVTLLEVLESIQGPVSVSLCAIDPEYCEKQEGCAYNKVWQGADRLLNGYFAAITLKDLFEQGGAHPAVATAMASGDGPTSCAGMNDKASGGRTGSCACPSDATSCTCRSCR